MTAALLGKKLGMTSIYAEDGVHIPCTVIEAGPCTIVQIKTKDNDGYDAVQLGYGEKSEKKVNKPELGHYKKAGVKPARKLKEFRDIVGEYQVGDVVKVELFQKGDKVKITGKSKGKGFQGVVKRYNFHGVGMTSHGQSDRQRHPGSIGQSSYPSRVFKGMKMAGRMGGNKVSIPNLEVVEVIPDQNIILIKGSVPGAINSFLEIVKQ